MPVPAMPMAGLVMRRVSGQIHVFGDKGHDVLPARQVLLGVGLDVPDNAVPAGGPARRVRRRLLGDEAQDEGHELGLQFHGRLLVGGTVVWVGRWGLPRYCSRGELQGSYKSVTAGE